MDCHARARRTLTEVDSPVQLEVFVTDSVNPARYQTQNNLHVVTNSLVSPGILDSQVYSQIPESFYGMYGGPVRYQAYTPVKDYNCFINRIDPNRQSWLYQLIRRGMFDQGFVTFNMDTRNNTTLPLELFEQQFEQGLEIFRLEHEYIRNQVPYRNFPADAELNNVIMQSKFSLVLETYFDNNDVITYSEKLFRCLKLPRPWAVFAMKGAVEQLRQMGYDVLDDIVDHSYDAIDFCIDRQVALLDLAKRLCRLEYNPALVERLERAAKHNRAVLDRHQPNFFPDVTKTFDMAVDKINGLQI
jgi:hypothetical protein